MKKVKNFALFRDILLWTVGSLLFSASVNIFTIPGGFIQGGITGISLMFNHAFGTSVGGVMFILNIPLFIWAYRSEGKKYTLRTFAATIISSTLIDITSKFMPHYSNDRLLGALFSGILCGAGLGLIYIGGATTGGSDLAGYLISKRKAGFSVGKLIFTIDACICLAAVFVYKSLESGMYGLIMTYISGKFMDALLDGAGLSGGRIFFIITEKKQEICREITSKALRGITVLDAEGFYSGRRKKLLLCAVRRQEISKMYSLVRSADNSAFLLVCPASDIRGFGFSKLGK